jgi:hypothetical protein
LEPESPPYLLNIVHSRTYIWMKEKERYTPTMEVKEVTFGFPIVDP